MIIVLAMLEIDSFHYVAHTRLGQLANIYNMCYHDIVVVQTFQNRYTELLSRTLVHSCTLHKVHLIQNQLDVHSEKHHIQESWKLPRQSAQRYNIKYMHDCVLYYYYKKEDMQPYKYTVLLNHEWNASLL